MFLAQLFQRNAQRRSIEIAQDAEVYDIIVVGLGTAGSMALIAAAAQGKKVLGIERLPCMGGIGTAGAILGYYYGNRGGLFEEIDREVLQLEAQSGYAPVGGVNGELKTLVLERHALAAGGQIRYETTVTGVFVDGQTVCGVQWLDSEGIGEARAHVVIDCTGDAEICAHLGLPMRRGRKSDQQAQPFSNVLMVARKKRVGYQYTDSGYINQEDIWDFSRAVVESALFPTHLKATYDDDPKMVKVAPQLGIREGRFIVGEECVTFEEYIQGQWAEEPVFYAYSNLDNHSKDVAFESEIQQDWSVAASLWGLNFAVPIPLGALIPQGMNGLMVAGRCLSIDHDMAACVRMKRDMQKCGEAAGVIAAVAVEKQVPIKDVPYTTIKPLLEQSGCLNQNVVQFRESASSADEGIKKTWLTEPEQIREGLSSPKAGIAIWSALRLGSGIRDHLRNWMRQDVDEHLRKHSALALGLLRDEEASSVLLEMVRQRDPFISKTSRKYNSIRGYAAVYLLGKLESELAIDELLTIVQHPEDFREGVIDGEFITTTDEYYFQYFSFAMMALFKIGERHVHHRTRIIQRLQQAVAKPELSLLITLKAGKQLTYDLTEKIRGMIQAQAENWNGIGIAR